jgi:endonuclease/exonuclease/phosphatase family metal-dependent hydrolase
VTGRQVPGATDAAGFRLATFNVESLGDAGPGDGAGGGEPASLAERIQVLRPQLVRLSADILCLQEVDGQRPAGGHARTFAALDALLAGTAYADYHRLATASRSTGQPRDKHNLVILSRWPISRGRQVLHHLVPPPAWRPVTAPAAAAGGDGPPMSIGWDRPFLEAAVALPGSDRPLNVITLHLKAPRAAWVAGGKLDAGTWRSMAGWAEGFFIAAVKRAGQALEVRLAIDALFDADPEALIAVCGDFNADDRQVPVRLIAGDEEDAGNPHLTIRTLVPLERSLAHSRRFSIVHHGRPQMLDHVLVSRPLLGCFRAIEVHNEALGDELVTARRIPGSAESFHAPVVAEFRFPDKMLAPSTAAPQA